MLSNGITAVLGGSIRRVDQLLVTIGLAIAGSLVAAAPAEAITFYVNSAADAVDAAPGNGQCETAPGNGVCTLRAAIMEANQFFGGEATVNLTGVPGGVVTLTIPRAANDDGDGATGDLDIRRGMIILGAGPSTTVIDGNGAVTLSRVIDTSGNSSLQGAVAITGITIRGGRPGPDPITYVFGGGIRATSQIVLNNVVVTNNASLGGGGGIAAFAGLTVNNSVVRDNTSASAGGGIYSSGCCAATLSTIRNSTISDNRAFLGGGLFVWPSSIDISGSTIAGNHADGSGGGIRFENELSSTMTISGSTISGNAANDSGAGISAVFSVLFGSQGRVAVFSSTIANNQADVDLNGFGVGGGVSSNAPRVTFQNTILAGNKKTAFVFPGWQPVPGECEGTITSAGFNVMQVVDCTVAGPAPIVANPLLGPLQANGGRTLTHAPLVGSPAIDAGDPLGCLDATGTLLATDQRGYRRAVGALCDMGAFEVGATAPVKARPRDFDGDGQGDLLWRHLVTGQNALWLMDGAVIEASAFLPTVGDLRWEIVGADDFDGDGHTDILWRDRVVRRTAIWLMDGVTIKTATFGLPMDDPACRVAGTGDFDGDTRADVLWDCAGRGVLWLMDGMAVQAAQPLVPIVEPGWAVASTADLNGDGKSDVLWRHTNGRNALWLMNGSVIQTAQFLPTVNEFGWDLAGAGDVDGDSRADVLWRHRDTGQHVVWLMDGIAIQNVGPLPTVGDLAWQMSFTGGDLNGDARADLVWRHATTGNNAVWFSNGLAAPTGQLLVPVPDPGWTMK